MTYSSRGRADLLRALGHGQPALTAAMAALLGYHDMPLAEPIARAVPSVGASRAARAASSLSPDVQYIPADVPFWRLEAYEGLARDSAPPKQSTTRTAADPVWRRRPPRAPTLLPLAPGRTIRTRLRRVSAIQRATAEIDLGAAMARLSRGELLHDVPHRTRRAWGTAIHIIEDRARRLVPYWLDQDMVVDLLRQLYPPHGVSIACLGDGESQPVMRWPEARCGEVRLPAPHTLVLVLGDLGCLATQGEPLQRFWLHWGRLLRDNHNPAVALVPGPLTDIPPALRRLWTVVRWDAAGADRLAEPIPSSLETVQRLLTLLAPAVRLEPGLLRAVRCLLPEGRRDAGLEARVWQDAALRSQHSVAATSDREWRKAALARFAAQPEAWRRLVLEQIRAWRAQGHEAVWFEEVLSMDPEARAVEAADVEDARQFMLAFRDTLTQGEPDALDPMALAYACRVTQRLPDTIEHDPEVLQAVHELYELVRPYVDETQAPLWYNPALRPPVDQAVRRVLVAQVADQVQLQVVEPVASAAAAVVPRGSPLGIVHTVSGEVILAPGQAPEPARSFWQGGQPPAWAQAWGDDAYGAWVTFGVNDVEQRLRWIPSGQFLMGSPADEEWRYGDEGPQHEVQLTHGFWLFDTPCTQALWQAVMGDTPSRFQGAQRPVEQVSWEDCQTFLERLNAQLPGLALRLPTEAQWEYACRAGTQTVRYHEDIDAIAWYSRNSHGTTHAVAQKRPNAWGLYDMLGNVLEWCHDGDRKYRGRRVVDPVGRTGSGADRALRGGGRHLPAQLARAARRFADHPGPRNAYIGFRGASVSVNQPEAARVTWSASQRQAEPAKTATRRPAAQRGDLQRQSSAVIVIPEGEGFTIRTDREQLRFGRLTRPAWATEIGRDEYGLWATFAVEHVRQCLRWIPPGHFLMGSLPEEEGRFEREGPHHEVRLTRGFWLFDTPCTQELWQAVMGDTPSRFQGAQRPVEQVSWEDCQTFLERLHAQLPGLALRLPTEAQWEYACRAGTQTVRYHEDIDVIAWYSGNSHGTTHAVAQKRPNAWGLYDMLGNVDEWCHDGRRVYEADTVIDPEGPTAAGADRALRGGSWVDPAWDARAAYRITFPPGYRHAVIGFRGASSA